MDGASDLELLKLEMDTLWGPDRFGRRAGPHPLLALALAGEDASVRLSPTLDGGFRDRLESQSRELRSLEDLDGLRQRLGARLAGGPGYVFETIPARADDRRVLTSLDDPSPLANLRPELWWETEEWDDLLAGRLGPWAVGLHEGRVASVCHTPVASGRAAEAGIWTHPELRGRGWAPVVTAAWAAVAKDEFETLFYSTSFDNASSQAVARKLGLRPIGWIGQLFGP